MVSKTKNILIVNQMYTKNKLSVYENNEIVIKKCVKINNKISKKIKDKNVKLSKIL